MMLPLYISTLYPRISPLLTHISTLLSLPSHHCPLISTSTLLTLTLPLPLPPLSPPPPDAAADLPPHGRVARQSVPQDPRQVGRARLPPSGDRGDTELQQNLFRA